MGSHFQDRKEACRIADERKFKTEYGIVSSHFIDHLYIIYNLIKIWYIVHYCR